MNTWKKAKLGSSAPTISELTGETLAGYCEDMFKESNPYDYVECMRFIDQPMGAEECDYLPEFKYDAEKHLFPYFQRFICMTQKGALLDTTVKACINKGSRPPGYDFNIVELNDCLKAYETAPGKKMNLRETPSGIAIYKRIDIPEGEE